MTILFYFISLSILFVIFHYLDKIFKFTRNVEESRFIQLDGLRAFLALSIVYHHSIIAYSYFITGKWTSPPSDFYAILGPISVSLFFMITGFLFGFKLFKDEFNIKYFISSRIRRIVPLYLFSVLILVVVVFYINDFILKEDLISLIENILRWASFKFANFTPINHDSRVFEIQSVYWTLKWEWKFYIALPFLFLLRKKFFKDKNILFISILLLIFFFYKYIYVFLFLLGVLASVLYIEKVYINKMILNIFGIVSLILIFSFYNTTYLKVPAILTAIFFFSVVLSNNFSYILNRRIFRYFGTISYSIYLLHNIVVFIIFYMIDLHYKSINNITMVEYGMIVFIIVFITSIISMFTYKYIEHKFYTRG